MVETLGSEKGLWAALQFCWHIPGSHLLGLSWRRRAPGSDVPAAGLGLQCPQRHWEDPASKNLCPNSYGMKLQPCLSFSVMLCNMLCVYFYFLKIT